MTEWPGLPPSGFCQRLRKLFEALPEWQYRRAGIARLADWRSGARYEARIYQYSLKIGPLWAVLGDGVRAVERLERIGTFFFVIS
jgi:hypothetical protein